MFKGFVITLDLLAALAIVIALFSIAFSHPNYLQFQEVNSLQSLQGKAFDYLVLNSPYFGLRSGNIKVQEANLFSGMKFGPSISNPIAPTATDFKGKQFVVHAEFFDYGLPTTDFTSGNNLNSMKKEVWIYPS